MDEDQKKVFGVLAAVSIGLSVIQYVKVMRREREKRKQIEIRKDRYLRGMYIAAGRVEERIETGYYDGHSAGDIMIDFELETIKRNLDD